jgi:hypothetical protein
MQTIHTTGATTRKAQHDETFRFRCHQCGGIFGRGDSLGTGYAVDREDNLTCYACCAVNDARELREAAPGTRIVHYYNGAEVINWPGTLRIKPYAVKHSRNNWNAPRVDVWFRFEGKHFHGVQLGDNEILRVRVLKHA